MTPEQEQAYDELMQIFTDAEESIKIKGRNFSQQNLDRYNEISTLCAILFIGVPVKGRIEIEEPTSDKPYVGVTIYMDVFELNISNKAKFIELINLADEIVFYGDEENYFQMTFFVKDIWKE